MADYHKPSITRGVLEEKAEAAPKKEAPAKKKSVAKKKASK